MRSLKFDGDRSSFGEWLHAKRVSRGWQMLDLAQRTGIDHSTISRVENQATEATLLTAVRLCRGLDLTVLDWLSSIESSKTQKDLRPVASQASRSLSATDITNVLRLYRKNPSIVISFLDQILIELRARLDSSDYRDPQNQPSFFATSAKELVAAEVGQQSKVCYPAELQAEQIFEVYRQGGVMTLMDAGRYLGTLREQQGLSYLGLEGKTSFSDNTLGRLERAQVERIKLLEVLRLDQILRQNGKLVAVFARASEFNSGLVNGYSRSPEGKLVLKPWVQEEFGLATLFILLYRWLQCVDPRSEIWVKLWRSKLAEL